MPGEVAAKHARVEHQCTKCHVPFDKAGQDRLCLACHTHVAADLRERRGYHGLEPTIAGRSCKSCHAEHRGRAAKLVRLDRERFEHRFTDMPFRGGHARVRCDKCHASGKRYREAPTRCSACHAGKDPHEGCLGDACEKCHTEDGWKRVRFDHDAAAFRLEGRHRGARCEGCHATKRYKPTATGCYGCHKRDDRHRGGLGSACQTCHTPRAWSAAAFDHARKTHFPLLGRHAHTACASCHKSVFAPEQTPTTCHGCHERDDAHRGQFGRACEACHAPIQWRRPTFEHDRSTHFPLRGRHKQVRCTDCHRGKLHEERLDTTCYTCHRNDDVHHGREGRRCDTCHDERGWRRDVLFDHDSTRFALTGAHARVECTSCHVAHTFKGVSQRCVSCHENEDVHHGKLGVQCERCHETSSFRVTHEPR